MSAAECASKASRAEPVNERGYERTSKRMSEWPSTYVSVLGCFEPLRDDARKEALVVVVV